MKTLVEFARQDMVLIKDVQCERNFKRRLGELGLFVGANIEIIKNDNFGPLLIKILDSKIAFDRDEAGKIYGEKI